MHYILSLLLSVVLLAGFCQAQAQSTMVVTKTDGTQLSVRVAEIQDVTFPNDNRLNIALSYGSYWLHPGQWVQLEAVCTTPDGEETYADIAWRSTNPDVVTVDAEGRVTAVGDGQCQVLAVAEEGSASIAMNVVTEPMLQIEVQEITNLTCSYTVTPADPTLRYHYDYRIQSGDYSVDGLDQYGSEEQNLYHFVRDWWAFCGDLYGMGWVDYMNSGVLVTGPQSEYITGLTPGSEYCLYAFATNEDGSLASPVEVVKFQTGIPVASDITFEVTMGTITSSSATCTITPSCDDPYFVNVQRASYVDWFIERDRVDDMVPSLASSFSPEIYPVCYCQGTVTRSTDDFLSNTRSDSDYYVIVFGYNEGQTSPVTLVKFHTKP